MKTSSILILGATLLLVGCNTNAPGEPNYDSGYRMNDNPYDSETKQYDGFKAAYHDYKCDSDSAEFNEGCERFYSGEQEV